MPNLQMIFIMNNNLVRLFATTLLSISYANASSDVISELFSAIKNDLQKNRYGYVLGKSKYYRINYLEKGKPYYHPKILLAEAYVLGKFCYFKEVDQIINVIKYYGKKYQIQTPNIEKTAIDLKLLGLAETKEQQSEDNYFEKQSIWPLEIRDLSTIKNYNEVRIILRSKC